MCKQFFRRDETKTVKSIYGTKLTTKHAPMTITRREGNQLEITLPICHEYNGDPDNYNGPVIFKPGEQGFNSNLRLLFTLDEHGNCYIKARSFSNTELFDYGEASLFKFYSTFVYKCPRPASSINESDTPRVSSSKSKFPTDKWRIEQFTTVYNDDEDYENPVPFHYQRIERFLEDCLKPFHALPNKPENEIQLESELDGLMINIRTNYKLVKADQYDRAVELLDQLAATSAYNKVPFESCLVISTDKSTKKIPFDLPSLKHDLIELKAKAARSKNGAQISVEQLANMLEYMSLKEGSISNGSWFPTGTVARIANSLQSLLPQLSSANQTADAALQP